MKTHNKVGHRNGLFYWKTCIMFNKNIYEYIFFACFRLASRKATLGTMHHAFTLQKSGSKCETRPILKHARYQNFWYSAGARHLQDI